MLTQETAKTKAHDLGQNVRGIAMMAKRIATMAMKMPKGSTARVNATEACNLLLTLSQKRLELMLLYASFAKDVPESVLQNRLK